MSVMGMYDQMRKTRQKEADVSDKPAGTLRINYADRENHSQRRGCRLVAGRF